MTESQKALVEAERPESGVEIATRHPLELARYRMPNGTMYVTLEDHSEKTWEKFCGYCLASSRAIGKAAR